MNACIPKNLPKWQRDARNFVGKQLWNIFFFFSFKFNLYFSKHISQPTPCTRGGLTWLRPPHHLHLKGGTLIGTNQEQRFFFFCMIVYLNIHRSAAPFSRILKVLCAMLITRDTKTSACCHAPPPSWLKTSDCWSSVSMTFLFLHSCNQDNPPKPLVLFPSCSEA